MGQRIQRDQHRGGHQALEQVQAEVGHGEAALDALAQLTGDWWQLTPSMFVRAVAVAGEKISESGPAPAASEPRFRCPACGFGPLTRRDDRLPCPQCGRVWAVRDGIYDFKEPLA